MKSFWKKAKPFVVTGVVAIVGVVLFFIVLNKAVPSVRSQVGNLTGL